MLERKLENYGNRPPGKLKFRLLIFIVAGLAVFAGLFIYADIKEVGLVFGHFKWEYIPLILVFTTLNYLIRFVKWHYYLRNIGIIIKYCHSLMVFLSGLSMSATPAKLGEVFKSYLLKRLNGTEVSRSVSVVLAERITDVIGLLILAIISFWSFQYGREILIVILAVSLALVITIHSRRIATKLIHISKSIPYINKFSSNLETAYESAYMLFKSNILLTAVVISVISWWFECLAMHFVLRGLDVNTSLLFSTFVFSFSSLAGAVSMVPGGLLVAEGSFTGLLMLSDISKPVAASATILIRFCTLWFGVIIGLITLLLLSRKLK